MRILHTSDWHLGQHFYGKSRANEHQQFLSWLLVQVSTQKVDVIIVAGDVFDTGTPPSYAREMYFDFIVNLHQLNCQLVVLAGNHDSVAMLGESKKLLSSLSAKVVTMATENGTEQVFSVNDHQGKQQAVICAVPFIRPRDVLKSHAGQSVNEKQLSLQQAISDHYQQLFSIAEQLAGEHVPIIATGHLSAVGVTSSDSVRDIYIGTLDAFPANAFPAADYIALGHIHRAQKVAKKQHIRYCGSPIPLSFDEATQEKVVLLVDFNEKLTSVTELTVPRFQAMAMIKTTLDKLSEAVNLVVNEQEALASQCPVKTNIWLDIEIDSADYLHDLSARIDTLVKELPVEILLVRRSKKSRELMPNQHKKITLNELAPVEVFATRINQELWQSQEEQDRKERLEQLFKQVLEQSQTELPPPDTTLEQML